MISTQNYSIIFGDSKTSPFSINEFKTLIINNKENLRSKIKEKIQEQSYFLYQEHSTNGVILKDKSKLSFEKNGDFIITNLKNIAIGILTADCLPIIFYDTINNVTAIAHAGWKGTINNIANITFKNMKENFGTECKTTSIFFGPSAKPCCYEVGSDFLTSIDPIFASKTLIIKQNKYYFDLPLYNKLLLEQDGFENFNLLNNICTICNVNFCSARREKENSRRQINIIMLK